MELKLHYRHAGRYGYAEAYNRTILELKLKEKEPKVLQRLAYNRTILELKLGKISGF